MMNTRKLCLTTYLILVLLWGCDGFDDREGCDGYPYVANNVLSDTVTLTLEGDPFRFDLAEAPIFKHTGRKALIYQAGSDDLTIAETFTEGESETFLTIYPRGIGTTRVEVGVQDECQKYESLGIVVQVVTP